MFPKEGLAAVFAPQWAAWTLIPAAPFIGSFLGVLICRLPEGKSVAWSRSRCEGCGRLLGFFDLIPFLGWLLARGRCRSCGRRLGWFYPGIEAAALAVAIVALAVDGGLRAWLDSLLGWWLLVLASIDLRRWILPDSLTLPLAVAGLAEAAIFEPKALLPRALGAVIGFLSLFALAFLYRRLRGREGLGLGDAKLFAASGAWLGAKALPSVLFAAAAGGLAAALLLATRRRVGLQTPLPFGPFLALATWLVWLFGPLSL